MDPEEHKAYHAKIEEEKELLKQKEKIDNVTKIGLKDMLNIPQRDNLKFKELAIYRAMCDGDLLQYEFLQNKLLTKPKIKGYALASKSIEEFEALKDQRDFESQNLSLEGSCDLRRFDESSDEFLARKVEKQLQKEAKKQIVKNHIGRKSGENSDKDFNIHSSRDYWEDIEPKMNLATKNLDFSKKMMPKSPKGLMGDESEFEKTLNSATLQSGVDKKALLQHQ